MIILSYMKMSFLESGIILDYSLTYLTFRLIGLFYCQRKTMHKL